MKVYMETMGCPKNFNDSQVAKGLIQEKGFQITDNIDECDVMILNTCGFINDAKKESISRTFELAEYKNDGKKLIMTGCLSERYSKDLFEEMPEVDCFLGVNEYDKLPDILEEIMKSHIRCDYVSGCAAKNLSRQPRLLEDNPYSATLKIAEGCDNRCAYCVIPYIRGPFRSKKMEDVIEEANWLAQKGCKELILIAQDVTVYGKDLYGEMVLPKLLRELCRIEGIEWIRLMYCYEDRITDELIEVMATEPKICHYIDIPIQHSSDNMLRAMNRRSTEESIRTTIDKLKKAIPDIHIRTTLITGFPGESEEDFDNLLDFVDEMRFARLGVFAYSQEENTPAGEMDNQIPEEIKLLRQDAIMRRQLDISLETNKEKVGMTLRVLVEERDLDGSYIGRTAFDAPEIDNSVIFASERDLKAGDFVNVLIQDAFDYDLTGMEV
ncbi:MAG: 30S ribosomal protein S12 methylthiotransferase RimO [Firmicutes bacterium]|nr:30S ribosomal protein S12 methylthiotransferase RimO [Bacillota bacterium]